MGWQGQDFEDLEADLVDQYIWIRQDESGLIVSSQQRTAESNKFESFFITLGIKNKEFWCGYAIAILRLGICKDSR